MKATASPPLYQPVQAPKTHAEYEALLAAGVLLDVGGAPLVAVACSTCDGRSVGATCPGSLDCPRCARWSRGQGREGGGIAGRRCIRPSGHDAMDWCADRKAAAEAIDDERERAGDPTLPRRWPPEVREVQGSLL